MVSYVFGFQETLVGLRDPQARRWSGSRFKEIEWRGSIDPEQPRTDEALVGRVGIASSDAGSYWYDWKVMNGRNMGIVRPELMSARRAFLGENAQRISLDLVVFDLLSKVVERGAASDERIILGVYPRDVTP